ncbi:MAG: anion transporter [Litorilinea sp.]
MEAMRFWLAMAIIGVTLVGVAVGRYPWLRMNRATIALTGATALIVLGTIGLEEAYAALDLDTLTLLFAMMILNVNLRRAGFFQIVGTGVVARAATPRQLLAWIIVASGVLSALFLNDTIVLVFTPLVVEICRALGQRPIPYLVALVTAANIGSAATITGNPQNMIIGVASGISYVDFAARLTPPALAGLAVIWLVIAVVYRGDITGVRLPALARSGSREDSVDGGLVGSGLEAPIEGPLLRKSLLATVLVLVGFLAGMPVPLAALGGAALLLISRRIEPERVFRELDWSLLVFFAGLFIVTGALETSGVSHALFVWLYPLAAQGTVWLAVAGVVLSNLVSNVPAVLLFRPFVADFPNPDQVWLTLALATTFAGNLTLLGSVANLIVAELARREGVTLGFGEYLKAGVPITLVSLTLGVVWLLWRL